MPLAHPDTQYLDLVQTILSFGTKKESRAGETVGIFGYTMRFDLRDGFPLLTTKKINFDNVYAEICWMLRGDTNIATLRAPQLWKPWADEKGNLGRVYGAQWVGWTVHTDAWPGKPGASINQIEQLRDKLKNNPNDRRMVVTAWNPGEIDQMALPPCHMFFQCNVDGEFVDLAMYQRSCDTAIGVPYNIAQYALMLEFLAKDCGRTPRFFIHNLGDAHIYKQHIPAIKKQLDRSPKDLPKLTLRACDFDERIKRDSKEDYVLTGYDPHPFIKFDLNV